MSDRQREVKVMASEIKRETVVSIKNAYLRYASEKGSVTALENVNLEIEKGEFICVLGPSGCGKSTLLKIIAGFHQPTEGTAMMGDTPITGPSADRGVVFQTPTLYPWLNIYQNVEYGPKMRKVPKDEREAGVKKYLELVGLKDFAKQKPYELSGGMKQRASLARVLVNQPKMILMDEPFAGNDVFNREDFYKVLLGILEPHETVILSTHLIEEVTGFIGRAVLLHKGQIAGDVQTTELDEQGKTLMDYVKETYSYQSDRVSRALTELTGKEDEDA